MAVLFTVLTCAAPAWGASDGSDAAKDSAFIAKRLTELGDKVYGPEAATTVAHLDVQSKFLDDALRLLDADRASSETDPELLRWRNSTEAALRTQLENPALINKRHAIAFARLTKESSVHDRAWAVIEFRSDVDKFALVLHQQVINAARTLPLEIADTEMQAIRREVDEARKAASGLENEVRIPLDSIASRYLVQYGDSVRGCLQSDAVSLAAERKQMRSELRTMLELWRAGKELKVDSSVLNAINRLQSDILSQDKEDRILARQAFIRGRYCLVQQLSALAFAPGQSWLLTPLPIPSNDHHPL